MEKDDVTTQPPVTEQEPAAGSDPAPQGEPSGQEQKQVADEPKGEPAQPPETPKEEPSDIRKLRKKAEIAEKALRDQGYEIDPATQTIRKIEQPTQPVGDVSTLVAEKFEEHKRAEQEVKTQEAVNAELDRLSAGDSKLRETIEAKFNSYKGDKLLTEQQARELVYDAHVVVSDGRGKRVSKFMQAGSAGAGGQGGSYTPDERSAGLNEKMDWLKNTAGYKFQNNNREDLLTKIKRG